MNNKKIKGVAICYILWNRATHKCVYSATAFPKDGFYGHFSCLYVWRKKFNAVTNLKNQQP